MNDESNMVSRRKLIIAFIAIFMVMGLGVGSLVRAQEEPLVVGDIFVNSVSDVDKKNDGKCTLREAIIAANKDKPSGGKNGECAAGKPDGPDGQGDIIVLQLPDIDPDTDSDIFTLTRNDSGNEDSSTTGDLDITSNIKIITSSPDPIPFVIEGGEGFSDRIFHILSGSLALEQVTIRGGNAKFLGGGIYVEGGELNLTNSTLTANHAGTSGGAVYSAATATLTHVTVKDNNAPTGSGLAAANAGSLTVQNTLIADNSCSGPLSGEGENLTFNAGGCSTVSTVSGDPLLVSVLFGGSNAYFKLAEGSAAVDAADAAFGLPVDQLGLTRPQYGGYDLGAIELEDVNDPPVAVDDPNVETDEDTAVMINVLSNDTDLDNNIDPATVTVVSPASDGSAAPTVGQPGKITYMPAADFNGEDSFSYQVCDAGGLCDTAVVTVTVNPVNDPATAGDDSATTDEDMAVTVDVQDNDSAGPANEDPSLTTTSAADGSDGTVVINANGTITYTPAANFYGNDSFTYEVCDSDNSCATATVTVTVNAVNDAPTTVEDSETTAEDNGVTIYVADNDSDVDGNLDVPPNVTVFSAPSHGTAAAVGNGTIIYTPDAHFDGSDSFVYKICDSELLCSTETVTVTVTPDAFIEVTNVCDSGPGSLRQAISDANATIEPDNIIFDLLSDDGSGCDQSGDTINFTAGLTLTAPVNIDGLAVDPVVRSTPYSLEPYITLNGGDGGFSGITIQAGADGSVIKNLKFTKFTHDGIVVEGSGIAPIGGITIENNVIANNNGSGIVLGSSTNPADNNTVQGNTLDNNCGSGVVIFGYELPVAGFLGNQILGNTITNNGNCGSTVLVEGTPANDGVTIPSGQNNNIVDNAFFNNSGLPIDLGLDGVTDNDETDSDGGANTTQNFPYLWTATESGTITGMLNSVPGGQFTLHFYSSSSCTPENLQLLNVSTSSFADGSEDVVPDDGTIIFSTQVEAPDSLTDGQFVIATATDLSNNTSEFGPCTPVEDSNIVFTRPWDAVNGDFFDQSLNRLGQSRWYRIEAAANSKIKVKLELLDPANTDLDLDIVGYNDLAQAYAELLGQKDLNQLGSEFTNDALDTAEFNPAFVNPAFVNNADYNPAFVNPAFVNPAFVNNALFSADVYSPAFVNPAFVNPAFVNDVDYNPAFVNPAFVNPAFVNEAYANPAFVNPAFVNGNAYSAAQMSSIVTASGNNGQEPEEMNLFTHNNPGYYYVRVRARQGGFDPEVDYRISFTVENGFCDSVVEDHGTLPENRLSGVANNYEAIILIDWERMGLNDLENSAERILLEDSLAELTGQTDPPHPNSIHAAIVDVGQDDEVFARNELADTLYQCAYAKNVVADGIKDIVDNYRLANPDTLKYIIIVGNDDHIPFYRHADQAGLGPEEQYVVPVKDNNASYHSLEANSFYSQDSYGSDIGVSMKNVSLPVPGLPVGRLVETPQQIDNVIQAYLAEPEMQPQSAFVSSYDFLIDGGVAVSDTLGLGNSLPVATLINNDWMASDLKDMVDNPTGTGGRLFDIGFWSGHFSATAALAADYETYYWTSDFINSPQDYTGAIIFSAGCHSGYNIVNGHAWEDYTPDNVTDPDWPAAMAQKGATLIAGTGYQYGDTDFVEYSERLYHEFTRALRSGTPGQAISIGNALVEAKKQYLVDTPNMSGIHQKALLEATIYGLPMNSVNLPGDRLDPPPAPTQLAETDLNQVTDLPEFPFTDDPAVDTPGEVLGLHFYDLTRPNIGASYTLTETEKLFADIETSQNITVTHLEGPDGVLIDAGAPVLPLDTYDATISDSNMVLRGVGFLGGNYRDFAGKIPLVSAATTEASAIHSNFLSFVFYPQQPWSINRFDALSGGDKTLLNITPAQYRTEQFSAQQASTQRQFDNLDLRLFYLADDFLTGIETGFNRPDASAAPYIIRANGQPHGPDADGDGTQDQVRFEVEVIVDPGAGMQQVWVSYTTVSTPTTSGTNGSWQPFFLQQDEVNSTLWYGIMDLPAGVAPENVRFIASAVSGVGLVTMSNNVGLFYPVGDPGSPTELDEDPYPLQGQIGTSVQFSADLDLVPADDSVDLSDLPVIFNIGTDYRLGWTDFAGSVTVDIPLVSSPPGWHEVTISFPGNNKFGPSTADTLDLFNVLSGDTSLTLDQESVSISSSTPDVPLNALLKQAVGDERPLAELTVTFSVWTLTDELLFQKAVITDQQGIARLGLIELPAEDSYKVTARFDGTSTYNDTTAAGHTILEFNQTPICAGVYALTLNNKAELWPANDRMHGLQLLGATDPDGDPLTYRFLDIWQDEPLSTSADGNITSSSHSCSDAEVIADRLGGQDGRVYHLSFQVDDGRGGTCGGVARIAVAHDQSDIDAIDGGPIYHSLAGNACIP